MDELEQLEQAAQLDPRAELKLWQLRENLDIGICYHCDIELGSYQNPRNGFNTKELLISAKDFNERADRLGQLGEFYLPLQYEAMSIFYRYVAKSLAAGSGICFDCFEEWKNTELGEATSSDPAPLAGIWTPPKADELLPIDF